MATHLESGKVASFRDQMLCLVLVLLVLLMGTMTAVRLGHLPSSVLQPFLSIEPVSAQTWNARVGRIYTCGANCFWCDAGYGEAINHHNISNTWNSVVSFCVAGPW